jgi:hypothetical protein
MSAASRHAAGEKDPAGVIAFTCVFAAARYTNCTSAEAHLPSQVLKPGAEPQPSKEQLP